MLMKSNVSNTDDEIEVLDERPATYARIRIRENQGGLGRAKCSVFLGADQLEEFARACLATAVRVRERTRGKG